MPDDDLKWSDARRVLAVELFEDGMEVDQIAPIVKAAKSTIYQWIQRAERDGKDALVRAYTPRDPKLPNEAHDALIALLAQGAAAHGHSDDRWTLARVRDLIRARFGVGLHVSTVHRLLHTLDVAWQAPEPDAPVQLTVATSYVRQIASFLDPRDVAPWLMRAELDMRALEAPSITTTLATFSAMLLLASELADEPAIGLFLGQRLVARTHGFVGYAAIHSATLRELFDVIERYVALRVSILRLTHSAHRDHIRLTLTSEVPLGRVARPLLEAALISLRNILSTVSLGSFDVRALAFPFPAPPYAKLTRDVANAEVRYDQPWAGLVLRATHLDAPLKMADPDVFDEAARICQRRLRELEATTSVAGRVRRILLENEHSFPSLTATAHRLHMTPRTLHRRLVAEGTSFRKLLDDVRHRLAVDVLIAGRASLDELAFMLGYSDTANFRRAFRRWTNTTPSRYRAQLASSHTSSTGTRSP